MIKTPRKLLKIRLAQRRIIWLSYYKYIIELGFNCLVGHYTWRNGQMGGLNNPNINIPKNLGKLQNHDQSST